MALKTVTLSIDGEQLVCEFELRERNAVIMHGAGKTTTRRRAYGMAHAFLDAGVGVIIFDFSGHGDSSGQLAELSLERRQRQAQGIIDAMVPSGLLYLCGFSMSGQTVCDILPVYKARVAGLLLACPAAYSEDLRSLPFGDPNFTAVLRTSGSWKTSIAFQDLATYEGKTVLVTGNKDEVIPDKVTKLYQAAARHFTYIEYRGIDHNVGDWLQAHPPQAANVVAQLID